MLKVEFTLNAPMIALDMPLHLDAIIAAILVEDALRREESDALDWQYKLPVKKATIGDDWVWKASQLSFLIDAGASTNIVNVRRYELAEWARDKGAFWAGKKNVIPSGTGHAKGFLMNLPVWYCLKAFAWIDADKETLIPILESIKFLGKNRRNGFGKITQFDIAEEKDGQQWTQRTLPRSFESLKTEHCMGIANTRPPYFRRDKQEEAWVFPIDIMSV